MNNQALNQRIYLAQQLQAFTGLTKTSEKDRFFLIVGAPGSGKTSFITRCTEKDPIPTQGLPKCTNTIRIYDYDWHGRRIHLIDTPGFSDPKRSDTQTLQVLASFLAASYANGVRIHGVLMLQSIEAPKNPATIVHNLKLVMAMCGFNWYRHFGIAITMWPREDSQHISRTPYLSEETLLDTFFAHLLSTDAFIKRYNRSGSDSRTEQMDSARAIIAHMIDLSDKYPAEIMRIQREVFRERRSLGQTVVGLHVGAELKVSEKSYRMHARAITSEWLKSLEEGRFTEAAELKQVKDDLERYLDDMTTDLRILGTSVEAFHGEQKREFLQGMAGLKEELFDDIEKRKRGLRELQKSLDEILAEVLRGNLRWSLAGYEDTAAIISEYEGAIEEAMRDLKTARELSWRFNEQTDRACSQIGSLGDGLVCSVM